MANLFQESWDWTTTVARLSDGQWTQSILDGNDQITSSAGGHGSQGLRLTRAGSQWSNEYGKTLVPSGNRFAYGLRWRLNGAFTAINLSTNSETQNSTTLVRILKGSATQCWARPNANGTISVYRGSTLLGTTSLALSQGVQYYIDLDVLVQTTGGSVDVYVDGVNWLSLSGINTANVGSDGYDEFWLARLATNSVSVTIDVDDLYVNDGSGSVNDTVWGDTEIHCDFPTGDGDENDGTPSTGSNHWELVDDADPDDDSTYVEVDTAADDELYTFPTWASAPEIKAVQLLARVRKTDAGAATAALTIKSGGTVHAGTTQGVPSSYAYLTQCFDADPDDSMAFDPATDLQFGVRKIA